ncbi:hypothetical protein LguiB_019128 [Lonicera macranthoides]
MDTFEFDNVKVEKAKAIQRYNRLRNIAKLFRLIEFCLALIFLSWISAHLPLAVRISGEYFRILLSLVVSPLFIFLLCNAIVIALLANSGQFSYGEPHLFEDFVIHSETNVNFTLESSPVPETETIVYEDKNIICGVKKSNTIPSEDKIEVTDDTVFNRKVLRRSQSENVKIVSSEKQRVKLRRSETEKCEKYFRCGDEISPEAVEMVEELSNEEFNGMIEAFIAKQVKFHQEEKFAIVVPGSQGFTNDHI